MIPDKSLFFVRPKKSDSVMNFPAFLYLGFLSIMYLADGVDIMAVKMEKVTSECRLDANGANTTAEQYK